MKIKETKSTIKIEKDMLKTKTGETEVTHNPDAIYLSAPSINIVNFGDGHT